MSQVGRIGGQVLTDNLLRAGVDLAFETDLLYLNVTNDRIGINDATPVYDLDVSTDVRTTDLTVDNQIAPGNLRITAPNTFSTSVGGINVYISGGDIFHDRLTTANLIFNDNTISSIGNSNIVLDPNGSGTVQLLSTTNVTGNVQVTGNISMNGNLTGLGTLVLGDQTIDTVTVNTDFTQSIIPGADITYALGADAGDSSPRRWAELHSPEWRYITDGAWEGSGLRPQSVTISNQMVLNGVLNRITGIQSNEDILLNPDTGVTYIERTKWEDSDITNLNNTPLTIAATGIGYYRFNNTNAFVIPSGTDAERRLTPEVGETRWNTDQQYLECFDGSVWAVSIGGGGGTVTQTDMEYLGEIYTLILG
jgi:hypothetical protein